MEVIEDDGTLMKSYPLFSAVNRCAKLVRRHQGRVIKLEYVGEGTVEKTLMLVGKVSPGNPNNESLSLRTAPGLGLEVSGFWN